VLTVLGQLVALSVPRRGKDAIDRVVDERAQFIVVLHCMHEKFPVRLRVELVKAYITF
jgi:hypothetical protein